MHAGQNTQEKVLIYDAQRKEALIACVNSEGSDECVRSERSQFVDIYNTMSIDFVSAMKAQINMRNLKD